MESMLPPPRVALAVFLSALALIFPCQNRAGEKTANTTTPLTPSKTSMNQKIQKPDEEWRKSLSPEQYKITRRKGTERAFTGAYWDHKEKGIYVCVCCEQPLFSSEHKFDSGTGWPSFWQPLPAEAVATEADNSLFMRRTEALCHRCGAHLGHVFNDGPAPTHQRYCINSASLKFQSPATNFQGGATAPKPEAKSGSPSTK